jgi:hypothetical protein
VLNAREQSGIDRGPVLTGLRRLKADRLVPGPGVRVYHHTILSQAPEQSILQYGTPDLVFGFGLEVLRGGTWSRLLGSGPTSRTRQMPLVIRWGESEEPVPWLAERHEDEERRLLEFKSQAWRVGVAAKSQESWCSTFEATMRSVGITAECVLAARPLIPLAEAESLMGRTVLLTEGNSVLVRRATQPGFRVKIELPHDVINAETMVRVVWSPAETERLSIAWPVHDFWDLLPEGLTFTDPGSSGQHYTIRADHSASSAEGGYEYQRGSFSGSQWALSGLPPTGGRVVTL